MKKSRIGESVVETTMIDLPEHVAVVTSYNTHRPSIFSLAFRIPNDPNSKVAVLDALDRIFREIEDDLYPDT